MQAATLDRPAIEATTEPVETYDADAYERRRLAFLKLRDELFARPRGSFYTKDGLTEYLSFHGRSEQPAMPNYPNLVYYKADGNEVEPLIRAGDVLTLWPWQMAGPFPGHVVLAWVPNPHYNQLFLALVVERDGKTVLRWNGLAPERPYEPVDEAWIVATAFVIEFRSAYDGMTQMSAKDGILLDVAGIRERVRVRDEQEGRRS